MNYYIPIQENGAHDKPKSQPRHTPRILRRRFALTTTGYKYLKMGISVGSEPFVEMILGDNKGNQLILPYITWQIFIERRMDIERLVRPNDCKSSSKLTIHDLVVEIVKICDGNIVKLTLYNTCIYMKPSTVQFLLNLEHCVESVYNQLYQNTYSVSNKYKKFITILRQNYVTNKYDAIKMLNENYDKTCIIECELVIYASDNIVYDALHN
ncbi:uncharacterized protein LOC118647775 [Monomorium pharaonis]|uniref:uncharacterized protein LOC118647775 n=1 Tax=Monomorium pharaonis TaxID=307658 RepID=UPI00174607C2|nr:uncharacterized protein LOC118647775 [Monomorium pharaonis]